MNLFSWIGWSGRLVVLLLLVTLIWKGTNPALLLAGFLWLAGYGIYRWVTRPAPSSRFPPDQDP